MEASGVLDLPGLSLPPEAHPLTRRVSESALRSLIVPGVAGRRVFRILLSDACRHACTECPMASQRSLGDLARPKKLAKLFVLAWRRGLCDGVFITSGAPKSATWAMEKLLETVETLRYTLGFRGYVHVKIPTGADPRQLQRMMALVDRVSFQLEPACARAEGTPGAEASQPEMPSQRTAAQAPARRRPLRTRAMHMLGFQVFTHSRSSLGEPSETATGSQQPLFEPAIPFRKAVQNR